MKIVVIGGTGLIGSKLVARLRSKGHDAVPASPNSGVNTITGEGLADALKGADVVVDVSNSPSFEDGPVMEFFKTSARNIAAAEKKQRVKHHVAMSIVGADRLPESGYLRAKIAQEKAIKEAGVPYTILRSTQFFEFVDSIIKGGTEGDTVRLPSANLQPIAADDVVAVLADLTLGAPVNGTVEVAGPEKFPLHALAGKVLTARKDPRKIVGDVRAKYFGTVLEDSSLTPLGKAHIGPMHFDDWFRNAQAQAPAR